MHVFAFKATCCAAHFIVPFLSSAYKCWVYLFMHYGGLPMAPGATFSTTGVSTTDLTGQTLDLYLMVLPAASER